jgi:DNA-binding beta-propeller fold protein YncE
LCHDGSALLVTAAGGPHAIHKLPVSGAEGSSWLRCVVGGKAGNRREQFHGPCSVFSAADGVVFVTEYGNNRVQVLTPHLDFHSFVGIGQLDHPEAVCANADIVVVLEDRARLISVFNRAGGARVRRFLSGGGGSWLRSGLCFVSGGRDVACADCCTDRVRVFSVSGEFIRDVGAGVLKSPSGVACSAFDELVVADYGNTRVAVFSPGDDPVLVMTMDCCAWHISGVSMTAAWCTRTVALMRM